ncbi:MAG TPA: Gldg family protein [Phycisphaerales bacterium]|nr:Gldg family protein [Phycisphaerales bacterium]
MDARKGAVISVLLLIVLFFAVNIATDRALRGARIDLTEHSLYTLSAGTRNILRSIEEPITLTLFFSEDLAAGQPQLQSYGKRVRELVEEYALESGGKIRVETVDPEPFSEGEERAQRAGISGLSTGGAGGQFYFGLLGVNSTDGRETVPFFDPREERFLEYTLSRLVYNLDDPEKKKVVVLSSLPIDGGGMAMPGQQPPSPWQIMTELRSMFEVETLDPGAEAIPEDADVLLVVHPKQLGEPMLRAIDDYVIGGGRAIVFVDPVCEADIPPGAEQNPLAAMQADRSSDLNTLLEAWGARVEPGQVAADRQLALQGQGRDGQIVSYVQYLGVRAETMSDEDAVTGPLSQLQLGVAGSIVPVEGAGTAFTPIVQTTEESMLLEAERVSFFADPRELLASFAPRGEPLTLAARLTGTASSAFAPAQEGGEEAAGPPTPGAPGAEKRSGEINVIVVSDVDMLSDPMWVREVRIGGMTLGYQQISDNGTFLINAADNMTGSGDLISVRARGSFTRPFTLVNEIRSEAEQEYLAEQQALEEKRRQAEQRIAELQRARPDEGGLILTPEQEAEIEKFREELVATNRQLRDVNYNLRKDVEKLGLQLKIINIGAAPLAVLLAAIGLAGFRAARRRSHRAQMASRRAS